MASNWSHAMLPLVSVSRHWSTRKPISSPATAVPATRCESISFRARLFPGMSELYPLTLPFPPLGERETLAPGPRPTREMGNLTPPPSQGEVRVRVGCEVRSPFLHRHERFSAGARVVGARANEAVVVVLLEEIGRPARDA